MTHTSITLWCLSKTTIVFSLPSFKHFDMNDFQISWLYVRKVSSFTVSPFVSRNSPPLAHAIFSQKKIHGIIHAKMVEGYCRLQSVVLPRISYTVYIAPLPYINKLLTIHVTLTKAQKFRQKNIFESSLNLKNILRHLQVLSTPPGVKCNDGKTAPSFNFCKTNLLNTPESEKWKCWTKGYSDHVGVNTVVLSCITK